MNKVTPSFRQIAFSAIVSSGLSWNLEMAPSNDCLSGLGWSVGNVSRGGAPDNRSRQKASCVLRVSPESHARCAAPESAYWRVSCGKDGTVPDEYGRERARRPGMTSVRDLG